MSYKFTSILVIGSIFYISGCNLSQPVKENPPDINENVLQAVLQSPEILESNKKMLCHPFFPGDLKSDPNSEWRPSVWVDEASGCTIGNSTGGEFYNEAEVYKIMGRPTAAKLLIKASIFLLEKNIEQCEEHWTEENGPEAGDSNIPTLKRLEYLVAILTQQEDYPKAKYYLEKMVNGVEGLTGEGSQEAKEKYLQSAQKFQQIVDANHHGDDAKNSN